MIIFIWIMSFLLVLSVIIFGLLKDLNTLIMKKYSIYFCKLSLHEVYESGEEYESMLMGELLEKTKQRLKMKESIQKGFNMSDKNTLDILKKKYESVLKNNGNLKNSEIEKLIKDLENNK